MNTQPLITILPKEYPTKAVTLPTFEHHSARWVISVYDGADAGSIGITIVEYAITDNRVLATYGQYFRDSETQAHDAERWVRDTVGYGFPLAGYFTHELWREGAFWRE